MFKFKHKTTGLEILIDKTHSRNLPEDVKGQLSNQLWDIGFYEVPQPVKYPELPYIELEQSAYRGERVTQIRYGTNTYEKFVCVKMPYVSSYEYDKNFGTLTLKFQAQEVRYMWVGPDMQSVYLVEARNPWKLIG